MTKQSKSSSKLVYVHGTNGSGKSTLARAVLAAAGGASGWGHVVGNPKAGYTLTSQPDLIFVGKYGNACGGVDGVQPYADVHKIMYSVGTNRVFAEGLVTPGLETCERFASYFQGHVFIFLDPPIDTCIANVLKRRGRKGTTKPYDPANLLRKRESSASWAKRLSGAGLDVRILTDWRTAYLTCLDELGLPVPDVTSLI